MSCAASLCTHSGTFRDEPTITLHRETVILRVNTFGLGGRERYRMLDRTHMGADLASMPTKALFEGHRGAMIGVWREFQDGDEHEMLKLLRNAQNIVVELTRRLMDEVDVQVAEVDHPVTLWGGKTDEPPASEAEAISSRAEG